MRKMWFSCLMILMFLSAVNNLGASQRSEGAKRLEEAIRRSCVTCYVIEGAYPQTLDYLQENYGIQTDSRYTVHYKVIASNLMPDITVTESAP